MATCPSNCKQKICIQAKKVFDACLKQTTDIDATITLTDVTPPNPVTPLHFVSGRSNTINGTIDSLSVVRIPGRPNYGRVSGNVVIPIEVKYTDNNGVAGSGVGTLSQPFDVILSLPEPSIIPYQIEASISAVCPRGSFDGTSLQAEQTEYVFLVDVCISVIIKVIIQVDILIDTYGYAVIPPCTEYSADACSGFFDLPLFPRGR